MLRCVINIMSPAVESSCSAVMLAPGKDVAVQQAKRVQSFCCKTDLAQSYFLLIFYSLFFLSPQSEFGLFNAKVCVGQLVLFVSADCCSTPLMLVSQ